MSRCESTPVIALLGQPNSGKSTIFNMITGSHQHVGNWPGKTVDQKEGEFKWNGRQMILADLPGSYSLSAGSDEEIITKDYITSGNADLVLVMADASQLNRSLYMLADFVGTTVPAVLVLNMIDVARGQGIKINTEKLSEKLGIPVVPMSARKNMSCICAPHNKNTVASLKCSSVIKLYCTHYIYSKIL